MNIMLHTYKLEHVVAGRGSFYINAGGGTGFL